MMLVDTDYRRRGIAKRLMAMALEHLSGCAVVGLDATSEGAQVYSDLGFSGHDCIVRMVCDEYKASTLCNDGIGMVKADELRVIADHDLTVYGADRSILLGSLTKQVPAAALIDAGSGETPGYCFGREGAIRFHIGPVVAKNESVAAAMVSSVLSTIHAAAWCIDVPERQDGFVEYLRNWGFVPQRSFTRMFRGKADGLVIHHDVYAVAGPEYG